MSWESSFHGGSLPTSATSQSVSMLIAAKEQELKDINDYRLQSLERLLVEKENENRELKASVARIKEDFAYNLSLLEERDAELERYDVSTAELKREVKAREEEASSLRSSLTETQGRLDACNAKNVEMESFFSEQLQSLKEATEAGRRSREEESKKWRIEFQASKADFEARLRAREAEFEATCAELKEASEAAISAMNRETQRRVSELAAREASAIKDRDEALAKNEVLRASLSSMRTTAEEHAEALRVSRGEYHELQVRFNEKTRELESRVHALTLERDQAAQTKAALLEGYETRVAALLGSLKEVEQAFAAQRQEYEARLEKVSSEGSAAAREFTAVTEARLRSLTVRLAESTASEEQLKASADRANENVTAAYAYAQQVEHELNDARAQLEKSKVEAAAAQASMAAQLSALERKSDMLTRELDASKATIAALQTSSAASASRADSAEKELATLNASFESRWQERERSAAGTWEASVTRKLLDGLRRVGEHQAATAVSRLMGGAASSGSEGSSAGAPASTAASVPSALDGRPQLASARLLLEAAANTITTGNEENSNNSSSNASASAASAGAAADSEEVGRLRSELLAHQQQSHALQQALMSLERDNGYLSGKCSELEDENRRFGAVVSGMRQEMEFLQGQLLMQQSQNNQSQQNNNQSQQQQQPQAATNAGGSSDGQGGGDADEYCGLLQRQLSRLEEQVEGLTSEAFSRVIDLLSNPTLAAALGDEAVTTLLEAIGVCRRALEEVKAAQTEEVQYLRGQLAGLQGQLEQAHQQLQQRANNASAPVAAQAAAPPQAPTQQSSPSLSSPHDDMMLRRLIADRERLLEMSNALRADLHRATRQQNQQREREQQQAKPATATVMPQPPPVPQVQAPVAAAAAPAAPAPSSTGDNRRLAFLESTVVSLGEQNARLQQQLNSLSLSSHGGHSSHGHGGSHGGHGHGGLSSSALAQSQPVTQPLPAPQQQSKPETPRQRASASSTGSGSSGSMAAIPATNLEFPVSSSSSNTSTASFLAAVAKSKAARAGVGLDAGSSSSSSASSSVVSGSGGARRLVRNFNDLQPQPHKPGSPGKHY